MLLARTTRSVALTDAGRRLCLSLAKLGVGLSYALEATVSDELRSGRLKRVLESFAPTVPGYFIYFPSRAQRSTPLRLFAHTAKELLTEK